jgi:RNA polymerase sigma-70 factor, ECF subfamily
LVKDSGLHVEGAEGILSCGTKGACVRNTLRVPGQAAKRPEMTKATELTDDGLLGRMIAGDEDAFTLLYRRRHPSIYRFALHMSGNVTIAEDVTQEVFMTLIRDPKRFDPARGTLGGFLFGVARNFLRKRWEQDRRLVALDGDANEIGEPGASGDSRGGASRNGVHGNGNGVANAVGSDEFATRETISRVRHAVATLPENYREVVVLCDLQEMSYEEASSALGCPVGTVRSRLHRARAILLEKLRDAQTARRVPAVGI